MKKVIVITLAAIAVAATTLVAIPALAHNPPSWAAVADEASPFIDKPVPAGENNYVYVNYGSVFCGGGLALGDETTLTRVADTLGVTFEQLIQRLQNGETIAAIATAQGVGLAEVIDTLAAVQTDMVNVLVKYGYVTQDEANSIIAELRIRIEARITDGILAGNRDGGYGCGARFEYQPGENYGCSLAGDYSENFSNSPVPNNNFRHRMMGW